MYYITFRLFLNNWKKKNIELSYYAAEDGIFMNKQRKK